MKSSLDTNDQLQRLWREWATRPPQKSPQQAALEVAAMVAVRRRRDRPMHWLVAAAAAMVLTCGGIIVYRHGSPPISSELVTGTTQGSRLGEGQVLIWLDDETPLYMTFQTVNPSGATPGGER